MKTLALNPFIQTAIEPMRQQVEDAIFDSLQRRDAWFFAKLEEAGWDSEKAFPYPSSSVMNRMQYRMACDNYKHCHAITESAPGAPCCRRPHEPNMRVKKQGLAAKNRNAAKKLATDSVNSWIVKMGKKVADTKQGEITSAVYAGACSPWEFSVLTISLDSGTVQKWKTKMILNVSCLGKIFNQYPSRLLK